MGPGGTPGDRAGAEARGREGAGGPSGRGSAGPSRPPPWSQGPSWSSRTRATAEGVGGLVTLCQGISAVRVEDEVGAWRADR